MGANKWRFENEWPPARATYQKYYFHSEGNANTLLGDGQLSTTSPKEEPADRFIYDPADPVIAKHEMGPYDQTYIEKREDVLVYSTPQLQKDVEVTGPVKVILYASSSAKNTDFTAKLTDVYPDGRSMRICEGIIRASYRDSEKQPSNIEPGKVYEYTINLWATSNLFKKGHQIRVEISSSSIPRFDRNLNTGNNFATDTTMIKAEQVIYHDKNFPSCIILPVIEESKN
jgi:putative CocE/NonD family hydrolase